MEQSNGPSGLRDDDGGGDDDDIYLLKFTNSV